MDQYTVCFHSFKQESHASATGSISKGKRAVASGMGTCGLVGQIGVYTGWLADIAAGEKTAITAFDWIGLIMVYFVLPAVLTWLFGCFFRKLGWIKENDLKLDL